MNSPEIKACSGEARRVLLIEPNLGGHRSIYLAKIAAHFASRGEQVLVVTLAGQKITPPLQKVLDENPAIRLSFHQAEDPAAQNTGFAADPKREFAYWAMFRAIFRNQNQHHPIGRVFLPYVDYCLYAMGVKGSPFAAVPFSGICMRPSFHFQACGVIAPASKIDLIKGFLFRRVLQIKSLTRIYPIDELLVEYFQTRDARLAEKLRYFPDPAEFTGSHTKASARKELGIREDEKVVLVYGALDERKGIKKLLDAVEQMQPEARPSLLLAGRQTESIQCLLAGGVATALRAQGKLIELNRFVSDEDEQMSFVSADVVWVVYEGHYTMSGVLVKAIQLDVPAVITSQGLIGHFSRKYGKRECLLLGEALTKAGCWAREASFHSWLYSLSVITELENG